MTAAAKEDKKSIVKKLLSPILALLMILSLLSGCTSGLDENDEDKGETKESTQESTAEPTKPVDVEKEPHQLYYNSLKDIHISDVGLAQLSGASWIHSNMRGGVESNPQCLLDHGFGGLLSAVVRDFDLDGDQDMVTFYMTAMPHNETWPGIYGGSFTFLDHVISMSCFTLENDQIVRKDTYPCTILLHGSSWG